MRLIFKHNIDTYGFEGRKKELAPKPELAPGDDLTGFVCEPKHVPLTEEFCREFMAKVSGAEIPEGKAKAAAVKFLRSFTNIEAVTQWIGASFAANVKPFKIFGDRETVRMFELVERYSMATFFRGGHGTWMRGYWTKVIDGHSLEVASKSAFRKIPRRNDKYPILVSDLGEWENELACEKR